MPVSKLGQHSAVKRLPLMAFVMFALMFVKYPILGSISQSGLVLYHCSPTRCDTAVLQRCRCTITRVYPEALQFAARTTQQYCCTRMIEQFKMDSRNTRTPEKATLEQSVSLNSRLGS